MGKIVPSTTGPANASGKENPSSSAHYLLPANKDTVHWGYWSRDLPPALTVQSGDYITVETISHHAGDDYDRMIKGDDGIESIFHWTSREKNVERRGSGSMDAQIGHGEGLGVHILTGPIAVSGARPGDILEVRLLKLWPRPCANPKYPGKTYGCNAAAWWGYLYNNQIESPKPREVITIYEVDSSMNIPSARAVYSYRWTPSTDPFGVVHKIMDYPGVVRDPNTIQEIKPVHENVHVPLKMHPGTLGLAADADGLVNSIPPSYIGGNMDQCRLGEGTKLYLPVAVKDALLSMGDSHAVQGDSELAGTAIEMSITVLLQVILHPQNSLRGTSLQNLDYPLVETPDEYIVQGFTYPNYLADLGKNAQSEIFQKSSLDLAFKDAVNKMRQFMMTAKGLTEDESITLMSIAADFGVTQVANGNWGMHGILKKGIFVN